MAIDEFISIRVVGDSSSGVRAVKDQVAANEALGASSERAGRRVSASSRASRHDLDLLSASATRISRTFSQLGNTLGRIGRDVVLIGGLGFAKFVKDGLAFNATMEQNRIAFTQFLGGVKAANKELAVLYQLAKTTPFQFADVTLAARKFAAFGFTVKQSNELLRTLADTASGLALDAQGIDRMVLAIGQIKSKGVLMSQDLRQLQELGAIDMSKLARDLGLTAAQMGDVGKQGVPAVAALAAIEKQWRETFGGQSQKQAMTFTGLLSTLKDNYRQFAGSLTSTTFDFSKTIFGKLNKELTAINDEFRKNPKLTLQAKIEIAKEHLQPVAHEIADEIGKALKDAHLGDKIVEAIDKAIPVVAKAGGRLGLTAVKAFGQAFADGDALTRLALGAFFVSKFVGWQAIFRGLGKLVAKRFAEQFAATAAVDMAASTAADGAIGGAVAGGPALSRWGRLGKLAGRAFGGAAATAIAIEISKGDKGTVFDKIADLIMPLRPRGAPPLKGGGPSLTDQWLTATGGKGYGNPAVVPHGAFDARRYQQIAAAAARRQGINPDTFVRQIQQESGFDPFAVSKAGAIGIAQFMPGTAKGLGVNPHDPITSLNAAAMLMARYIRQYGGWKGALTAYNAGPGAVGKALPKETQNYISKILGGGGGGGAGGPIKWSPVGSTKGKSNLQIEAMSLESAISWLQKNYPGVGFLLEDKGAQNQHLHISSANHKQIRAIAKALNDMGFSVGEYGGKPIPGIGGITTLKHKHYGAADHYHGGAIDVNSDTQLTRAFGVSTKPNVVNVPKINVYDQLQGQLEHIRLLVEAGLLPSAKGDKRMRDLIRRYLPNLSGDAKLQALISLRGIPVPKVLSPAQSTWTPGALGSLAVAYGNRNPGFIPPGGWAQYGQDRTVNNPWLQAALGQVDKRQGAGEISQAIADGLKKTLLENALPFMSGNDALDAQALLKQIADNTRDTAIAAAQAAASARAQGISAAGFLGGLTGPAAAAVTAALGPFGINTLPGGGTLAGLIGNPTGASDLANADITALMGEVNAGTLGFADVWPQILSDLGVIAGAATETAANTADMTDFWKQAYERSQAALAISQTQYGVFKGFGMGMLPNLGGFDSGGIVPGPRGMPGLALVHGGETILPTHRTSVNVHPQFIITADAAALGVKVDRYQGRRTRQLSVAPGGAH